jgi:molecular chaperone GrpE
MTEEKRNLDREPAGEGEPIPVESAMDPGEARPAEGEEADELSRVKSRLIYLAAEFDNYRKRTARERETIVSFGNERLLKAILPFLDNLERAISQTTEAGNAEAILSGVRMIYDQVLAELRKFGLEPVESVGRPFDPNLHEAVGVVPWEGSPEGTVLAESLKGYLLNGRLLRPAHVTVAQSPAATGTSADGEEDPSGSAGRES